MTNLLREHMTLGHRALGPPSARSTSTSAPSPSGFGFVDLVGSTPPASGLTLEGPCMALTGFESAAWDIASAHGDAS